jgi:uncharacterized membrane protein
LSNPEQKGEEMSPDSELTAKLDSELIDDALEGELVNEEPEVRRAVQRVMRHHRGPLPSPETFGQYDLVLPGAAERILRLTEKSLDHRISVESIEAGCNRDLTTAEIILAKRAQIFTFLLTLVFLAMSTVAIFDGQPIAATAAGVAALGTIAYALRGGKSEGVAEDSGQEE